MTSIDRILSAVATGHFTWSAIGRTLGVVAVPRAFGSGGAVVAAGAGDLSLPPPSVGSVFGRWLASSLGVIW